MKTILVATNYSAEADNAINYAASLAKYTNSKMVLFNSFELSVHALNTLLPVSIIDELYGANKERLKKIASNISSTYRIHCESFTKRSDLKDELDYQMNRLKATLLVMGINEARSAYEFENTTTSIIHHAKYPILAVPTDASFGGISKILFAFDAASIFATNKLPLLTEVAVEFDAQVQICHVEKTIKYAGKIPGASSTFNIETLLNKVKHFYKEITEEDVLEGIEKEVEYTHPDLLVMVPRRYSFWEGIRHKSKTLKMVRRTHIPLLTLPNPEWNLN